MSRSVITLARTWHRHRMFAGVMIALTLVLACGVFAGPCAPEPALAAPTGGMMLTTRSQPTVTDKLGVTRAELVNWLKSHEHDSYYLGTPYYEYGYKSVPNGDCPSWDTPGMNCNGFVHHALCAAHGWRDNIDSKCPDMTGWSDLFASTQSYYFSSKDEMLSSGVLEKGDLVWMFVQAWSASDYNHIGIYWPEDDSSSSEDRWWDSIDSAWDGGNWIARGTNAITQILPKTASELWIVCKLDSGGNLQLAKSSADSSITDGNNLYSLANAQYGVYTDEACTDLAGTLTCNADGTSNTLEKLAVGTYYVKETAPPAGYRTDAEIHAVEIKASETTVLEVADEAQVDRAQIKLWKVDRAIGEHSQAQGGATLAGARFTISYYNGLYDEGALPASATRTWIVQTNEQGVVDLQDASCKVAGPDFYTKDGSVCFPLGTVTIAETTAPTGYAADPTVHHFKIAASSGGTDVEVLRSLDVPDTIMRGNISLDKNDWKTADGSAQGAASLAGAVFEVVNASDQAVVSPQTGRAVAKGGVVCTIVTDAAGAASTDNARANGWSVPAGWDGKALAYGSYTVREKSASAGYLVNEAWTGTARIAADGQRVQLAVTEEVMRGNISLDKNDWKTADGSAQGAASLAGAVFEVVNASDQAVVSPQTGRAVAKGGVVCTITTDAAGAASTDNARANGWSVPAGWDGKALAYGSYTVREKSASEGYLVNEAWSGTARIAADGRRVQLSVAEEVMRGNISLDKNDWKTADGSAQGAASLDGAVFEVVNASDQAVISPQTGRAVAKGGVVCTIVTDAAGAASTDNAEANGWSVPAGWDGKALAYGAYLVREKSASEGYLLNTVWTGTARIAADGQRVQLSVAEEVMRGNISLIKSDKELARRQAQGKASLSGAVYEVVNANDRAVVSPQTGRAVAKGDVVCTIVTDAAGAASTDNAEANGWSVPAGWNGKALAYGAYLVREKSPSTGYLVNTIWSGTTSIKAHGATAHIDTVEQVIRGGLMVGKIDREYREYIPLGGSTLEGAAFEIVSNNPGPVIVDGTEYSEGAVVKTIVTSRESDERYVARTDARCLPYGTYTVREVRSSQGYLLDNTSQAWSRTFSVTREGGIIDLTSTDDAVSNQVIRGDFSFNKRRGADMAALAGIPFRITSLTTGEWHVIVTDANGMASTASSWNTHSTAANINDVAVGADGTIDESKLDSSAGIWFSGRTDQQAAIIDGKGALPYDTYRIEELRCSGNDGLDLVRFTLSIAREGTELDLGTIEDKSGPSIATSLADTQGVKMVPAGTIAKLIDTVSYYDLTPGTYVMRGQLHLIGADGTDEGAIAEAERAFTARGGNGTVKMTFSVDTSSMEGKRLVAFEQVLPEDGDIPVAEHADLADEDQTVTIPAIATTLTDSITYSKEAGPAQIVQLTDTVAYSGLDTTKTYTLSAVLHVRDADGNDVGPALDADGERITARQTFSPDKPDGTAEVTFTFERSAVAGKTLVAFEELLQGEERYAAHARIDDEAQTVTVPAIGTTAHDAALGGHESCAADAVEIIDTVEYRGFMPGIEYTVLGTLHLRASDGTDAGPLKSTTGEPVTASTTFTPEQPDGSVDVVFRFSGSQLGGSTLVVFEQVFRNDELYAEHADISDQGQTVSLPKVSTSARGEQSGTHAADASAEEAIVDTVAYTNLTPDRKYTLQATLHERDSEGGDAGVVTGTDGKPIAASAAFTPESADGSVDVRIPTDMEGLADKTIVVFEELYDQNGNTVAHHRDISSAEQSVTFHKPKTPPEEPEPDQPTTPEKPEQPDVPDQPTTPDQPDVPDQPTTPEQPKTPEQPSVPDQPSQPVMPETPERPDGPNKPDKPATSEKKIVNGHKTILPTTGDAVLDTLIPIAIVAGMALVLAVAAAAIAQRTGRNDLE